MISELKAHFSKYLALVWKGERVVVRDRKTPVAKLVPFTRGREKLRLQGASLAAHGLANLSPVRLCSLPT